MNAIEHIRRNVFHMTQKDFAAIAGVPQSRVSRWETDNSSPSLEEIRRIRTAAKARKLKGWSDDKLLFAESAA